MEVKLLDLRPHYRTLREEIRQAIDEVCDSQSLILGPAVERFEKNLAEYCRTRHAIGVSSGTDALLCSLMALEIKPGDEVICPSFTFFATAGCIARLGAVPVFADIELATFNISPKAVADRITRKTKAIMPVHLFGQCADMTRPVHRGPPAWPAHYRRRRPSHRCRSIMATWPPPWAWPCTPVSTPRKTSAPSATPAPSAPMTMNLPSAAGSSAFMARATPITTNSSAAISASPPSRPPRCNVKLKYLDQWHAARQRNAALYDELLADSPIICPTIQPGNRSVYNQYVVRIGNGKRDAVKQRLADHGIGTGIYYPLPLHRQPCFAYLGVADQPLPESDRACREVLALPIYPELSEEQIRYVAKELSRLCRAGLIALREKEIDATGRYCPLVNENPPPPAPSTGALLGKQIAAMQQQLESLHEQLLESQRLATIGTIAAVIAHEFNNLLTPIVSYSQYALQTIEKGEPDMELIRKALSKSYQSSAKAGRICTSMLGLARGESSLGEVDLQKLVEETLLVLAREPQKDGIALRVQIQPGLQAWGDAVQLEQVLLNLLINARQAMLGKGGSILSCAAAEGAGQLRLQVIDSGPGIPLKLLPKIFQPFFTTKGTARRGETKGTGLGLAICKQIVEHHKGRIEVDSEVGKGTTFSIFLPIAQSSAASAA